MLGVPSSMLNDPDAPPDRSSPEQDNMRLLQHGVEPWISMLERGLSGDTDLFPDSRVSVELDAERFLRADIHTRWDAYRLGRQGGWITANEIRAKEGLPPAEGGDEIQQTPVGGAANTQGSTNDTGSPDANIK